MLLVLIIVTAALISSRARIDGAKQDADPLFIAGIAIAGASAALVATIGLVVLFMTAIGVVCILIGANRSRARSS